MCLSSAKSQTPTWTPLSKTAAPISIEIIQYDNFSGNLHYLGIGITNPIIPQAKFHIRQILLLNFPSFQVEATGTGSIKNWYFDGITPYGIYQSGPLNGANFFENKIVVGSTATSGTYLLQINGNATVRNDLNIGGDLFLGSSSSGTFHSITCIHGGYILNFNLPPAPEKGSDPTIVFSLANVGYPKTATVNGKLITETFKMTNNPGTNYLLASDSVGNGSWIDPSRYINDFWRANGMGDIYTNYRRVGIGTSTPSQRLEVCTSEKAGGICINQLSGDSTIGSEIVFKKISKPQCSFGQTINAGRSCCFIWSHIDTTNNHPIGKTEFFVDLRNGYTGIGNEWPQATLDVNGSFKAITGGIGINPPPQPDSYKFWVDGGIAAREVKVTAGKFPDFVFEKNYSILSLEKLEEFVTNEKHLPDVPSQSDIDKNNGINIGDFQTKLLQKIEEQTLYIISLQKQINELREEIKSK